MHLHLVVSRKRHTKKCSMNCFHGTGALVETFHFLVGVVLLDYRTKNSRDV